MEANYLKIIKAIYEKPTDNSILNGESKALPLRALIRQGRPRSSLLFDVVPEVLTRTLGRGKGRKVIRTEKKTMNLCSQVLRS